MNTLFDLKDRKAVITGGAGLLGAQHARALLFLDCTIELWDIDDQKLIEVVEMLKGEFPASKITSRIVDVTSENEIEKCANLSNIEQKIDILINNAAINPKFVKAQQSSRFESYSRELWDKEISVGLTGAMLCAKYIGTTMSKAKKGIILNVASDLSVIAPDQRIYRNEEFGVNDSFVKPVSYSVIKTGLIGLTRYLATYWADSGVRVNALSPGGVYDGQPKDFVRKLENLIPLGRMANQDEYVGAIQFLCSDASKFMTGQNVIVDGGRSVW